MPMGAKVKERSQGATEYLLMLGAVLTIVAGIVASIVLVSQSLGSDISGQVENTMDNLIIPGLVGALLG